MIDRFHSLPVEAEIPPRQTTQHALEGASQEEQEEALSFALVLAKGNTAQKEQVIRVIRESRGLREVDLWMPGIAAQKAQAEHLANAGKLANAWLFLAAAAGRQDILAASAAYSIDLLAQHTDPELLLPVSQKWIDSAVEDVPDWGAALLWQSHARCLRAAGKTDEAQAAQMKAKEHQS